MEAKMTSYNIIKMGAYYSKMAAYYYKMAEYFYKMNYDNKFYRSPFHPGQQFLVFIQGGSSLLKPPFQRKLVI
jgi:hypothetical protein